MVFIFITGLPATGKTTLAQKIAQHFQIPVFGKDDFKEILFNNFESKSIDLFSMLGKVSYDFLYLVAEENLRKGKSIIIEANFDSAIATEKIQNFIEKYNCKSIQIRCFADGETLVERFTERNKDRKRHFGHLKYSNEQKLENLKLSLKNCVLI